MLKVTLVRSMNGRLKSHKSCVRGLGIRRMQSRHDQQSVLHAARRRL